MKRIALIIAIALLNSVAWSQYRVFPEDSGVETQFTDDITWSQQLIEVDPSILPNQNPDFEEITSISSGDWNDASIWDCTCVPNNTNSVTIAENHIIEFSNDLELYTLHVRELAVLSAAPEMNLSLDIKSDLAVYGSLNIDKSRLTL